MFQELVNELVNEWYRFLEFLHKDPFSIALELAFSLAVSIPIGFFIAVILVSEEVYIDNTMSMGAAAARSERRSLKRRRRKH